MVDPYYDPKWTVGIKRAMIGAAMTLFRTRGTKACLDLALSIQAVPYTYYNGENLRFSFVFQATTKFGLSSQVVFVMLNAPQVYSRTSSRWVEAARAVRNYTAIAATVQVTYNNFYMGYSLFGEPLFSIDHNDVLNNLTYPAVAAYSVRRLNKSYMGKALRVRRSSDNTTLEIGFLGDNLDTAAILAFVGGVNGFVDIWYDQSGNGYSMVSTVLSKQPQIVASGALILNNKGKVALKGSIANEVFMGVSLNLGNTCYLSSVFQDNTVGGGLGTLVKTGLYASGLGLGIGSYGNGDLVGNYLAPYKHGVSWNTTSLTYTTGQTHAAGFHNATDNTNKGYLNGVAEVTVGSGLAPYPAETYVSLFGYVNGNYRNTDAMQSEVILVSYVSDADIATIYQSQKSYYNL
jgi:hypothetical protein